MIWPQAPPPPPRAPMQRLTYSTDKGNRLMDLKKILGLRPKNETTAAIREAIARAEEDRQAALARIGELEANRGALLLSGDHRTIEAAERDLAEKRMEAERCAIMAEALRPTLATAQQREKVAEIVDLERRASQEVEAFVTWWRTRYADLAAQMLEGARMEAAALTSIRELGVMSVNHHAAFLESGVRIPQEPVRHIHGNSISAPMTVAGGLQLPPPCTNAAPLWPEKRA